MFFMSGLEDPFHLKILILFTSKPWESMVVDPRVLLGSPCLYPIGYLGYPEAMLACEPNGLCYGLASLASFFWECGHGKPTNFFWSLKVKVLSRMCVTLFCAFKTEEVPQLSVQSADELRHSSNVQQIKFFPCKLPLFRCSSVIFDKCFFGFKGGYLFLSSSLLSLLEGSRGVVAARFVTRLLLSLSETCVLLASLLKMSVVAVWSRRSGL